MSYTTTAILAFLLSFIFALYFVPVMRKAAIRWGVVDSPDGRLKSQGEPVPYLGGIAIYISFLLSIALLYEFSPMVLGILLASTIMLLIGLVDDFGVLTPFQKLMGQFLATVVLVKSGIYIQIEWLPVWVTLPVTFFWMLAVINAINIIDIMDGLSGGVAFCACLVLFAVATLNGHMMIGVLTLALAGSLMGFLIFNSKPAKIYMGDTGSLFVGLMVGALAMAGSYSDTNNLGMFSPVLILGIPLFDTLFVILMRAKKGLPVFLGSSDHYALRLRKHGLSVNTVVGLSCAIGTLLGILAVVNMFLSFWGSVVLLGGLLLVMVVVIFWLNKLEV